jgi:polyisoprenyl-teichoic acid--peptidoglycan teichoic acid transferase
MRSWLTTTALAIFVVGGMAGAAIGLRNLSVLNRPPAIQAVPVAAAPAPTLAPLPQPTPQPAELASHPPMRDFDQSPPPFQPAGQADTLPIAPTPQPRTSSGRMNILLMGIDQRPDEAAILSGDPGRTDSMVLVSIDFDNHLASMVSIPRDGFVVIPGHGNERVNAAYTFGELDTPGGGPGLAERTVEQLFGVHIDHYALVDIHSMQQVIDTLGGIWIDNPQRLVDSAYPTDDYRTIKVDIPAGRQLMDGLTAVEYARTRHPDSDYGRQNRQQQVLLAIRDRALQVDALPRLPALLPEVRDLVHTDITLVDAVQLANFGRGLRASDIIRLPADPTLTPSYIGAGGASYINLTPTYRAMVHAMVTDPRVAAEKAAIAVYNAGAPVGSGSRTADVLGAAGLLVNQVATAPRVPTTRIEAGGGARHSAELVAQLLGLSSDALVVDGDSADVKVLLGPDLRLPSGA